MSKPFVPSPYQQAVFDHFANPTGSIVVKAVAGSGKSTTIARAMRFLPPRATATLLAFNKDASVELAAKVAENDSSGRWAKSVRTFHSAGMGAYRYWRNNVRVDDAKVFNIIDRSMTQDQARVYGSFIKRMVSLAKSSGIGYLVPDSPSAWFDLREHFDVYLEIVDDERYSEAEALSLCSAVLSASRADLGVIDFDDMLYMPLVHNVKFFQVDCLIVDEAQDTNAVQLALMKRMVKPKGWVCAVGDPRQAIYAFRGADSSALDNIRRAFGAKELPLTVSYRCAQSIVAFAKSLVPYIEAHDDAPEGSVSVVQTPQGEALPAFLRAFRPTDFVLCRNTAPLISLAYALIGAGTRCTVLGREIGKGLVTLISRMNAQNIEELEAKLEAHRNREVAKWQSKHNEAKAQAIDDKVECIFVAIDRLDEANRTVPELVSSIEALFSDRDDGSVLTLATVHKAKGLERDRVFVWAAHLMPSKWARQDWAREQEDNLRYVAWTRARLELILVEGE